MYVKYVINNILDTFIKNIINVKLFLINLNNLFGIY